MPLLLLWRPGSFAAYVAADLFAADTNFAPLILKNGSIVAIWYIRIPAPTVYIRVPARAVYIRIHFLRRHWGGGNGGSRQFLATVMLCLCCVTVYVCLYCLRAYAVRRCTYACTAYVYVLIYVMLCDC